MKDDRARFGKAKAFTFHFNLSHFSPLLPRSEDGRYAFEKSSIWHWVLTSHSVVIPVVLTQKQNVNLNPAINSNKKKKKKKKDHKEWDGVFPLNTTSPSITLFPPTAYLTSDD